MVSLGKSAAPFRARPRSYSPRGATRGRFAIVGSLPRPRGARAGEPLPPPGAPAPENAPCGTTVRANRDRRRRVRTGERATRNDRAGERLPPGARAPENAPRGTIVRANRDRRARPHRRTCHAEPSCGRTATAAGRARTGERAMRNDRAASTNFAAHAVDGASAGRDPERVVPAERHRRQPAPPRAGAQTRRAPVPPGSPGRRALRFL
jgi:hypothetical protein